MIDRAVGRIRVLDPRVANKIAAGEVVERPASVVKELVENALDAGASRVEVFLEKGGRELIRVVDDGWGMDDENLRLAFAPHATSKLADVEDLERIATLGFRGEALASIGSVSRARILSRPRGAESGAEIRNDGGVLEGPRPAAAAPGTEVTIQQLFYNTPARAKFMRTARTELGHAEAWLARFAVGYPEVAFRLVHEGRELLRCDAGEDRRTRILKLFGRKLEEALVPVRGEHDGARMDGFIALPFVHRGHARDMQFFLNGRFVRDRVLIRVVRDAYRDALHHGRSPVVFLFLSVDPERVDVNVHPTKAEVRWRDGRIVHALVGPALRQALRGADHSRDMAAEREARVTDAVDAFLRRHDGSAPAPTVPGGGVAESSGGWPPSSAGPASVAAPASQAEAVRVRPRVFQVHDSYLVCEVPDGIAIVDTHALHERVQYDRILGRLEAKGVTAQRLLVPEEVELEPADLGLLEESRDLLARAGFEWTPFGERSVALESIPALVPRERAGELLRDLVDLLRARGGRIDAQAIYHDVADTMACKAAVRFGDRLTVEEAEALLEESGALDRAFVCPHGRPTVLRIPFAELERRFGRR